MDLRNKIPFFMNYTSGYLATVTGTNSLVLPKAKANGLKSVTAFGNTQQRNLPEGYTQVEYISFDANSKLEVTDCPVSSTYRVEFEMSTTTMSSTLKNYIGGRNSGVAAGGGFRLSRMASNNSYGVVMYGFDTNDGYTNKNIPIQANTRYKYTYANGVCTLTSGDTVIDTHSYTINDFSAVTNWGINCYWGGTTFTSDSDPIIVHSLKIWNENNELVLNFVPTRQGTTVGLYNTVTNVLKTASAGTWSAGPEVTTPSPTFPLSLVCNNGFIKARKQSGLPNNYTLVDGVTNTSSTKLDTGIIIDTDDLEIELRVKPSSGSWYIFQSRASSSGDIYGIAGANSSSSIVLGLSGNSVVSLTSAITRDTSHIYYIKATTKNGKASLYVKDETANIEDTQTSTYSGFVAATTPVYLWGNTSQNVNTGNVIYMARIKKQGQVVLDYVPTTQNSVPGFYDKATNAFIATTGTTAGTEVLERAVTYVTGTTETIIDSLSNAATCENLLKIGSYQDRHELISGIVTRNTSSKAFNGTENWVYLSSSNTYYSDNCFPEGVPNDNVAPICSHYTGIARGGATLANMPDKSIKSGTTSDPDVVVIKDTSFTTVDQLKSWLAAQYAAGTPVVIAHTCISSTTETVTPQTLQTQSGTNTIQISQSSINYLTLSVTYKRNK